LKSKYKIGFDHQSVQSVSSQLSCKKTALKCCTKIDRPYHLEAWSLEPRPSFQRSSFQDHRGGDDLMRYYYYFLADRI